MDGQPGERSRQAKLKRLADASEGLRLVLAVVLLLIALEMLVPLSPEEGVAVSAAQLVIWALFVAPLALRVALARDRPAYIRHNWIAAVSVALPSLRLLQLARLAAAARSVRLARLLAILSRSTRSVGQALGRRQFPYPVAIAAPVVLASTAGVVAFEREAQASELANVGNAIWWAAATVTTMSPPVDPPSRRRAASSPCSCSSTRWASSATWRRPLPPASLDGTPGSGRALASWPSGWR